MKKLVWLACFSLIGCSAVDTTFNASPQAVVEKRAVERWQALIRSDVDAAYKYLTPALRNTMSLERYRDKVKPGLWRNVKVSSVACQADTCKAKVVVQYDIRDLKGLEKEFEETWLKESDNWWYVWKD